MRSLLRALALLALLGAPALAQQQTIGISGLPVATAPNPQTDYALGIVQQLNPAGVPFFVTSRVPLSKLVGPAGTPAYLTGVNVTTLPAGAPATGVLGGASPNYILNLGLPAGPAGTPSVSGIFTPGDFVLANSLTGMALVDGGAPGAAAFKPLAFFLQAANNLSDVSIPATARANLAAAKSGANSDITALAGLTTPLSAGQGGTGAATLSGGFDAAFGATQGGVLFRSATGWAILAPGTSGQVLGTGGVGGNPAWTNTSQGTVTSVALALPSSLFTVSGSPVTASGTLTGVLAAQSPNQVFAGPPSGSAAAPTFRALIPADDPAAADGCVRISVASTTQVKATPYGCNTLSIGGAPTVVTAQTVTLPSPSASTVYYAYAIASGTTETLYFTTAGHLTGSDGREDVNSGGSANAAYRLVGMCHTNASSQIDLCANWFKASRSSVTARTTPGNTSTSSTSVVDLYGSTGFLTWSDESVALAFSGGVQNNTSGVITYAYVRVDGSAYASSISSTAAASQYAPLGLIDTLTLSEGYHAANLGGQVGAASTATFASVTQTITARN